jgi:hypothetical protein
MNINSPLDPEYRLLSRYKGQENVKRRIEFIEFKNNMAKSI